MTLRPVHWLVAVGGALALHLSAALLVPFAREGAIDDGEQGIEVGLGLMGNNGVSLQPETSPVQAAAVETTPPLQAEPVEKPIVPAQEPSLKTPSPAVHKPISQSVVIPESTPTEVETESVSVAVETASTLADSAQQTQNVVSTGIAHQISTGGEQGAQATYFTELAAWLARHKPYPFQARVRRQQGVVEVRFTLQRNGSLLQRAVTRSSGFSLLDRAALQMLDAAAPMPAFPASMSERERTFTVPISFTLIQ